jgi:Tol biopolymer transport system component
MAKKQDGSYRLQDISQLWVELVRLCCLGGLALFVAAILACLAGGEAWAHGDQITYVSRDGSGEGIYYLDVDHDVRLRLLQQTVFFDREIVNVAWSPDGQQLALVCRYGNGQRGSLYVATIESGTIRRVLTDEISNASVAWSPDSSQLVVLQPYAGETHLHFLDVRDGVARSLTLQAVVGRRATWSPDSDRIAYVSRLNGNEDIWLLDIDSGGTARLTTNPARDSCPGWSPDGAEIAFISERSGTREIHAMRPDGTAIRQITDLANASNLRLWAPTLAWSPDGTEIAFMAETDSRMQLFSVGADGVLLRQLTHATGAFSIPPSSIPVWAPTGDWIAFQGLKAGSLDVFVVDRNGTRVYALAAGDEDEVCPAWRP